MLARTRLVAALFFLVPLCVACAEGTGSDPAEGGNAATTTTGSGGDTGGGDQGGAGGDGGAGAQGGAGANGGGDTGGGGDGGSGGATNNCGNGKLEPGESCDGMDFGGKTCKDYGLGTGNLQCNAYCGIVVSGCVPNEICTNLKDDDQDGKTDCLDEDCAMELVCTDSCAFPKSATVPGFNNDDTTGKPDTLSPSCTAASGSEVVFVLIAPATKDYIIQATSWNGDISLSVRTDCKDVMSELSCVNAVSSGFTQEQVKLSATQGATYYIIVDAVDVQFAGMFDLMINEVFPEAFCDNMMDDDADGYLDCDDSDCQPMASCVPGIKKVGADCIWQSECAATIKNDPVCLESVNGWPGGYCSEFCDLNNDDCPADAVCANLGLSVNGVCLDSCTVDGDCRSNYSCQNKGLATKVCAVAPESQCNDAIDNDGNGFMDCEDTSCQALPACNPGASAVGATCTKHSDCQANANDPVCLDMVNYFWPDGYCSEFCNINAPDCPMGSVCWNFLPFQTATCLDSCVQPSDCRPGYQCLNIGAPTLVCVF